MNTEIVMWIALAAVAVVVIIAVVGWSRRPKGTGPVDLSPLRRRQRGMADLLNLAALVSDGVVLTKSGALIGGFYYRGRDLSSSTTSERNFITGRVNAALSRLGAGWVTWQDAIRLPSPAYSPAADSHFTDPVSALIDAERREHFTAEGSHFESEYALIFQWLPAKRTQQKIAELAYDDDARDLVTADPGPRIIEQFEHALQDIEDFLGDVLKMRRMRGFHAPVKGGGKVLRDELVTYLQYVVTGTMQPINIPNCPMYLDALIGGQELWAGDTPKIGEQFISVVSIEGLPAESSPNMLDALDHLAIPYRWSTRFVYLDQHEALDQLSKFRRKWKQKERGFFSQVFRTNSSVINEDAVLMRQTAEDAMTDASSGLVTFGYYTPVVVLYASSRQQLEEHGRLVVREVRRIGFAARVETINTMESWLGSIPGNAQLNIRRPVLHTLNLADLVPLASVWPGPLFCPAPEPFYPAKSPALLHASTSGSTPFRFDTHVGDVGHTLILGPTGAGKSTLLAIMAAQFRRYRGATIVAFDKGRSLMPLVTAIRSGKHYDLASDSDSTGLCPLQFLDSDSDAAWAEDWLASCFELQANKPVSPRQKEELHRAVRLLRESSGRSLTDFVATVQDEELRSALAHYTIDGQMGRLLDARQDGLRESDFSVFELEDLMQLGLKNTVPVLLYLFRRFEKQLRGQPAMLILDEAWLMLGHAVFREKIREWLKVLRKANCSVVLATQSLSDVTNSGIFDVLIESCPTKILLPNEDAHKTGTSAHPGPRDLYQMMGLNETEIEMLRTAQKKRHYYYSSPEGRRLFDLAMGPIALAFCGVSDKEQLRQIRGLAANYGESWPFVWLDQRGVDHERFIEDSREAA